MKRQNSNILKVNMEWIVDRSLIVENDSGIVIPRQQPQSDCTNFLCRPIDSQALKLSASPPPRSIPWHWLGALRVRICILFHPKCLFRQFSIPKYTDFALLVRHQSKIQLVTILTYSKPFKTPQSSV